MVGVIPDNRDSSLTDTYEQDPEFWDKTARWKEKGWELALHGCYHKYTTKEGGINPVNQRSEFAGVPLDKQKEMIRHGVDVLKGHEIEPKVDVYKRQIFSFFIYSWNYYTELGMTQKQSGLRDVFSGSNVIHL